MLDSLSCAGLRCGHTCLLLITVVGGGCGGEDNAKPGDEEGKEQFVPSAILIMKIFGSIRHSAA